MKRLKHLFSYALVCVLAASLFTGCSGGSSAPAQSAGQQSGGENAKTAPGDKTLRVAWWGNQMRNDITVTVLNMYTEQNPHVKFESEFAVWDGYWDKIATQAAAGSLPDIIQVDYRYFKQYQGKGQLAGLNKFVESGALDISDMGNIIDSGRVEGELYAVPLSANAPAMFYDKEAAEAAGVKINYGITLKEFIAAAEKIYDVTGKKYDSVYYDGGSHIEFFVRGNGKVLFMDGKLGIDSPDEVVGFFKHFEDAVKTKAHMSAEERAEYVGVSIEQEPLSTGKSWVALKYSNNLITFNKAAGKEFGIVNWPLSDNEGVKAMFLKPGCFFSVAETSANKEEASKVIDYFINSVEANMILNAERGMPVTNKVIQALKEKMDPVNQEVLNYLDEVEANSSVINPPPPEGISEVFNLCDDLIEQVVYGQMTAEQAADKFFANANSILAKAAA